MQLALFQIPVFLAFLISSLLFIYTWQYRHEKSIWAFLGLLMGVAIWSFFYWLELASLELSRNLLFAKLEYVGIVTIPAAWLLFVSYYTEQASVLTKHWKYLLLEPIIVVTLVWTNDSHRLIWDEWSLNMTSPTPTTDLTYGLLGWGNILYAYTLFIISLILIARAILHNSGLYRNQLLALLFSFFLPWVGNALYIFRVSPYVDLSPFAFAVSGLIVAWAILRFRFLDVMPVAYKMLIQNLSDGILVLDEKYNILDMNQAARNLLHIHESDVIGKPAREIFAQWADLLQKYAGQETVDDEITIEAEMGNLRHLEVRLQSIYDKRQSIQARVVTIRDITHQREKENILRRHALLFENITDAITFTRNDGVIYDCNQAHLKLFGYSRDEIIGKTPEVWHIPGNYPKISPQILESVKNEGRWAGEIPYVNKSGVRGICEGVVVPLLDARNQMVGQIGVFRDITERKETEALLRTAKEAAERANEAKSLFLANVSHELRTPLTAIIGYAELIELELESASPDEIGHDLRKIQSSSDHLLNIVNSILNLARIEAHEVELMLDTVDIPSLVEEVKGTFIPLLDTNQNELEIVYASDIGKIYSDSTRINQILINLLTNANKFTKNGKLKLMIEREQANDHPWIYFKVSDTGIGIPKDLQEAIFEPFNQADNSYTRIFGGTGLGLTITKAYCKLLQGDITVESEEGQGSTFTVKLPTEYTEPATFSETIG